MIKKNNNTDHADFRYFSSMAVYCSILIFLLVSCFLFLASRALSVNCDSLTGDAQKQCRDLEKKAKIYQNIIDLKNKQQDTLASQVDQINIDQETTRLALLKTQKETNDLESQISSLERDITDKEKAIAVQKKILSGLMQTYYEYDEQGLSDMLLTNEDTLSALTQSDYLEQSGVKVKEVLAEIQSSRDKLLQSQSEIKQAKEERERKKADLFDKHSDLEASESQKQALLIQTQGEETKYKQLLARVEAQKKELFNFSEASNLSEINASVDSYPKPSTNLASTSWYFSQKDSRWGSKKIGNSNSLMEDYGCAVACVSMVFRKMGSGTDPGKMAKEKMFYYDLIKWPATWSPGITLASSISHGNIKWSMIDSQISKGNPVIVYIRKTNGRGGHYVVITGKDKKDYIVHDPYFGPNLYLGTSKSLVGKIGTDSKVVIDQMIIYN